VRTNLVHSRRGRSGYAYWDLLHTRVIPPLSTTRTTPAYIPRGLSRQATRPHQSTPETERMLYLDEPCPEFASCKSTESIRELLG